MESPKNAMNDFNMILFPLELLIHIAFYIPNETFKLSRVCKLWVIALNKKILAEKMANENIAISEKYNIIKSLQDDSYALSMYVKKFKIIDLLDIKTINSNKCLDILTWNMYNSKLNEYKPKQKKCSNCRGYHTGEYKMQFYEEILKQYCVINGTLSYVQKLFETFIFYNNLTNALLDTLYSICLENKSHDIGNWIKSYRIKSYRIK